MIERIKSVNELEKCAEIYVTAYNAAPWNDNWNQETAKALLTCYYNTPQFMGWVALQDNVIVACAIGNIEPYYSGSIFILKELFVCATAQGAGFGSGLILRIKADLENVNIKTIMLFTRKSIFNFYIKSGFKEMDEAGTMVYYKY